MRTREHALSRATYDVLEDGNVEVTAKDGTTGIDLITRSFGQIGIDRAHHITARHISRAKLRQQTINAITERARGVFAQLGKGIRGIFGNTKS